jgi:ATP-dependent DNA ligase
MLAEEGEPKDVGRHGWAESRKYDGNRVIAIRDGDRAILRGRSWRNSYSRRYPEIVGDLLKMEPKHFIIDSELTFFKKGTDDDVRITSLAKPDTKAKYDVKLMVFDVLYIEDESLKAVPFSERQKRLEQIVPHGLKHVDVVEVVTNPEDQKQYYRSLLKKGAEGAMLKEAKSPYREGVRSHEWLKIKEFKTEEAVVIGVTRGEGERYSTFGSLILAKKNPQTGKWVHVGNTSGFTKNEGKKLLARLRALKTDKEYEYTGSNKPLFFTEPKIVIEVRYFQISENNKYRHPDFTRVRDDKNPDEVTL